VGNTRESISQNERSHSDFLMQTHEWKINGLGARINEVKNIHTNTVNRKRFQNMKYRQMCFKHGIIYTFLVGRRMLTKNKIITLKWVNVYSKRIF